MAKTIAIMTATTMIELITNPAIAFPPCFLIVDTKPKMKPNTPRIIATAYKTIPNTKPKIEITHKVPNKPSDRPIIPSTIDAVPRPVFFT